MDVTTLTQLVGRLCERVDRLTEVLEGRDSPLLDASEAAALFRVERETFLRTIACRPGFPPASVPTGADASPRWLRDELLDFARKHRRAPRRRSPRRAA